MPAVEGSTPRTLFTVVFNVCAGSEPNTMPDVMVDVTDPSIKLVGSGGRDILVASEYILML